MLYFSLILLRVPHWLMIWSEYCLGGNPHLNWFVEFSWTQNLKYHQFLYVSIFVGPPIIRPHCSRFRCSVFGMWMCV